MTAPLLPPEDQTDPGVRRHWRETTDARLAQGAKTMADLRDTTLKLNARMRMWTRVVLPGLTLLGASVSFVVTRCDKMNAAPPSPPAVELRGSLMLQLAQPVKPDGGP